MKRSAIALTFGIVVALVAWSACSKPAKESLDASAASLDPLRAEREALFGAEALTSDVTWRDSGLGYRILTQGDGAKPGIGGRVRINYVGRLKDGTVFDRTKEPIEMRIGGMVPGLSAGLQLLNAGGKAVFFIPPKLGYEGRQVMGISPNSGLIFDVELAAVLP
jgi:FKBP-type peptidyl-prolyl cis-trans isomerase FklB